MGLSGREKVETRYDINTLNSELVEIYQQVSGNDLYSKEKKIPIPSASPNYT